MGQESGEFSFAQDIAEYQRNREFGQAGFEVVQLEPVMNFPHLPISCGLFAEPSGFQVFDNREIERKLARTPRNLAD